MSAKNCANLDAPLQYVRSPAPSAVSDSALGALIRPNSVLVIGASAKRETSGNRVLINLNRLNFSGSVVAVHPFAVELNGYGAAPSISEVSSQPDVAFISVAAQYVLDTLRAVKDVGCKAAVVNANNLDAAQSFELKRASDEIGLPFVGPNCMGLINFTDSIPLYTDAIRRVNPPGRVALVAQSGSAAIAMMTGADCRFSKVVTSGNELTLTSADLINWFAGDDATDVVGVVMESMANASAFVQAVCRLREAGKSLVVLKVGRSPEGGQATQAHTGALVSSYDAYDAFFREQGVATVADYDELSASLTLLSSIRGRRCGHRIGIVSSSGGQGALASDVASELGVPLAALSPETVGRVRAVLPGTAARNPIDLGGSVGSSAADRDAALKAVLADPGVDAVLVIQDLYANLPPELVAEYMPMVQIVARAAANSEKVIAVSSCSVSEPHGDFDSVLTGAGVPLLRGVRESLIAMLNAGFVESAQPPVALERAASGLPGSDEVQPLYAAVSGVHGPLPRALTARILDAYGIPMARSALAVDVDDAARKAKSIGYPVVLKIVSTDVPHRAEVSGVLMDISDENDLRGAYEKLTGVASELGDSAVIEGFEVQEQIAGGVEAIAGFKVEAPFGATLMVGSGGTLAELQRDRAVGIAPLSSAEALYLICQTNLAPVLGGYRRVMRPTPAVKLADTLVRLSALASDFADVIEAGDLNPLIIEEGTGLVAAVDALLIGGSH